MELERYPDESQSEYRTRYNREFMRIKREKERQEIAAQNGGVYKRKGRGVAKRPPSNAGVATEEWYASRQQPDETDEEYKKRSTRERQARYRKNNKERLLQELRDKRAAERAAKGPAKKRGKGLKPLKNSFLTEEEWSELRQHPSESDEDYRKRYNNQLMANFRERNYERLREERLAWYQENKEAERQRVNNWRKNNLEKAKVREKRHYEKNKEKYLASLKAWAAANPEKLAIAKAAWYKANKGKRNAYTSLYRYTLNNATPPWVVFSEIEEVYNEAVLLSINEGVQYHVDHIIALRGKTEEGYKVSGLHVPWNLQVITASENMKKHNNCSQTDALDPSAEGFTT